MSNTNNPLVDQLKTDKIANAIALVRTRKGIDHVLNDELTDIDKDALNKLNRKQSISFVSIEDKINVIEENNDGDNKFMFASTKVDSIGEFLATEESLQLASNAKYDFHSIQQAYYQVEFDLLQTQTSTDNSDLVKIEMEAIRNRRNNVTYSDTFLTKSQKQLAFTAIVLMQALLIIVGSTSYTSPLQSMYESIRLRPVMEFIFFSIFPSTQLSFFVVVFHFLMKRDGPATIYDIECSIKAREVFQYFSLRNVYHIIVMSSKLQSCLRNTVEVGLALNLFLLFILPIGLFTFIAFAAGPIACLSSICSVITIIFLVEVCEEIMSRIMKIYMIQEKIFAGAESRTLTLETYFRSLNEVSKAKKSMQQITFFTLVVAAINGLGALLFFLMSTIVPKNNNMFIAGIVVVGILIFFKEILLFFYITYKGCMISENHSMLLVLLSKKRWGAPNSALENERLSLFIAATTNPVHYEIRVPNYISWLLSFTFYIFRAVI